MYMDGELVRFLNSLCLLLLMSLINPFYVKLCLQFIQNLFRQILKGLYVGLYGGVDEGLGYS